MQRRHSSMCCGCFALVANSNRLTTIVQHHQVATASSKSSSSASRKRITPYDAFDGDDVVSVSNWRWHPFCTQFTKLVHSPTLNLPKARSMEPAMRVFGMLDIDEAILRDPPKTGSVSDHCDIENVVKRAGFLPDLDVNQLFKASPAERERMIAAFASKREEAKLVRQVNESMVQQLVAALEQENIETPVPSGEKVEGKIDYCAKKFLDLCGFDTKPFWITAEKRHFKVFGKICSAAADQYVVLTPNHDLVLIFEDKALPGKATSIKEQGHLGQITGELLQCLSINREKKLFRSVFGIRFINYHVTAFRVDATSKNDRALLQTLVETQNMPERKLRLMCSVADPFRDRGLSLINKKQRGEALNLMANMREFILKHP